MRWSRKVWTAAALATLASVAVSAGEVDYVFCSASIPQRAAADGPVQRGPTYFSAAFVSEAESLNQVSDSFLTYLGTKYAVKPLPDAPKPVICTSARSLEEAQSLERARMRKAEVGGGQVIDTGWTYMPEPSAR